MRGAIVGDIVGSVYEWHNIKTKDFPLFSTEHHCFFTDDTVLTCATAFAIGKVGRDCRRARVPMDYEALHDQLIGAYRWFTCNYPDRGYGSKFLRWAHDFGHDEPYNSCGNGSAMRVSPAAWLARSEEECIKLATMTAEVTHNHPDGIAGAVCTARLIWHARLGETPDQLRAIAAEYYPMDFTVDEIRPTYTWGSCCYNTVPQAVECALEATDFEDAIRNAISIGGDSDTLAAITGSIAEAMFGGVPEDIWAQALTYLTDYESKFLLKHIIRVFDKDRTKQEPTMPKPHPNRKPKQMMSRRRRQQLKAHNAKVREKQLKRHELKEERKKRQADSNKPESP